MQRSPSAALEDGEGEVPRLDVFGTILAVSDAKRHWRTDSVELAIDPGGRSENTSTTFKAGVFPATAQGGPFAARDADNRQGPSPRSASGLQVASRVTAPYGGYTLELKLPFAELPAAVRPGAMGLNLFVYDSDTQGKTGQNRHGWSTWQGVQGDPYRWGRAVLEGFSSPPGAPTEPKDPVIPREVARSLASPQSIAQAARDDVGLAGGPRAARGVTVRGRARRSGDAVLVPLQVRERGTVHAHLTDSGGRVSGDRSVPARRGRLNVRVRVPGGRAGDVRRVAVALEAAAGGTDSATARVGR